LFCDPELDDAKRDGPALFLDRDGVINVDYGYVCSPEKTVWVDGIFDLAATAAERGLRLVVVTNQAGIARRYYTEQQFLDYTRWMHEEFRKRGLFIEATVYCPHHPVDGVGSLKMICPCRKPAPGMLLEAERVLGVDLAKSVLIGDKASDIEAGHKAGLNEMYFVGESFPPGSALELASETLSEVRRHLQFHQ